MYNNTGAVNITKAHMKIKTKMEKIY